MLKTKLMLLKPNQIRMLSLVMFLVIALLFSSSGAEPVFAQSGGTRGSTTTTYTGGTDDATSAILTFAKNLGNKVNWIVAAFSALIFSVGSVIQGGAANFAQQFGRAGAVSTNVQKLIGGVAVFVLSLFIMPLIGSLFITLADYLKPQDLNTFLPY